MWKLKRVFSSLLSLRLGGVAAAVCARRAGEFRLAATYGVMLMGSCMTAEDADDVACCRSDARCSVDGAAGGDVAADAVGCCACASRV